MSVVSVYAVFADAAEAERIGRTVVEERLAACINILGPVRSVYRWKGAVETADEFAAIFKTWRSAGERADHPNCRAPQLRRAVRLTSPIDKILRSYAQWVEDSTG